MVRPPVLLPPTISPTWSLTGWYFVTWLVSWPIAACWLADCLSNKMSSWPSHQAETSCGHMCDYFGHIDLWSDEPPRDISWPSEIPHGPLWDFRPGWHLVRCQIRSTSCQMPPPPTTEKVVWTGKDDWPPGRLLHDERPFTREGHYLVNSILYWSPIDIRYIFTLYRLVRKWNNVLFMQKDCLPRASNIHARFKRFINERYANNYSFFSNHGIVNL